MNKNYYCSDAGVLFTDWSIPKHFVQNPEDLAPYFKVFRVSDSPTLDISDSFSLVAVGDSIAFEAKNPELYGNWYRVVAENSNIIRSANSVEDALAKADFLDKISASLDVLGAGDVSPGSFLMYQSNWYFPLGVATKLSLEDVMEKVLTPENIVGSMSENILTKGSFVMITKPLVLTALREGSVVIDGRQPYLTYTKVFSKYKDLVFTLNIFNPYDVEHSLSNVSVVNDVKN